GNTFGELFRVTTAGVSHGPGYLAIIDGCPPGLELSADDLLPDLRRRRPGQSKIVTQRDEPDMPEIWSGVFEGKTDGTPIGISFKNADQRSDDYSDIRDKYRPGHADYTFDAKFGFRDYGLGEPVFDKLKADLAKAMLSLPAVTAFEYGNGFAVATMRGSQNNDAFVPRTEGVGTETNRHGGMLGGISSGMPVICRVAVKPTSSLPQPQKTVTRAGEPTEIITKGRHDPCLLPRFVPMGEAMMALVLADHWLRHKMSRLG